MTRDEILAMAREADPDQCIGDPPESLFTFAALVAAHERERIIAANAPEIERINAHIRALEEAARTK